MPQSNQVIGSEPAPYLLPRNLQQNLNLSTEAAKKRKRRDIGGIFGGQQSALNRLAASKGLAGSGAEMRGAFNLAVQQMGQETEEMRRLDYEQMDEERKWAQQERGFEQEKEKMGLGAGYSSQLQKEKGDLDAALQEGRLTHEQYQNELDRLQKTALQQTQIEQDQWMQGEVEKLTRAGWSEEEARNEAQRMWQSGEAETQRGWESGEAEAGRQQQTFMQEKIAELTRQGWGEEAARQQAALDWEQEKMYGPGMGGGEAGGGPGTILTGEQGGPSYGGTYGLAQQQMKLERDKMDLQAQLTREGWTLEDARAEVDRQFQKEMTEGGYAQEEEMARVNAELTTELETFKANRGQIAGAMQNYSDWLTLRIQRQIKPDAFNQAIARLNQQLAQFYGDDWNDSMTLQGWDTEPVEGGWERGVWGQ